MKHTPGPWNVRASNEYAGCYFVGSPSHIPPWPDEPESIATVRLIRAAPEMLEALEVIEALGVGGINIQIRDMARAAIAKARGERHE